MKPFFILVFFILVFGFVAGGFFFSRNVSAPDYTLDDTLEHTSHSPILSISPVSTPSPAMVVSPPSSVLSEGEIVNPLPSQEVISYPWHSNITATVFWVGEPIGNGSSEDNALSCWDDRWQEHYGGYDDPFNRNGYYPADFMPQDQNFYVSVPYDDFDDEGRKASASVVVPWAGEGDWSGSSMMKGQWVEVQHNDTVCYAQVNDCGPYEYDDSEYVFALNGKAHTPKNKRANNDGMDVSPALRDCLHFKGLNNADNKINWRFISALAVPDGPWKEFVTSSNVFWE